MLVEDNPSDIELIMTAFEESNIDAKFTVYRDGEEAIKGVRNLANDVSGMPKIAFLDLNLPRASGHEVLAAIRELRAFDDMPVLVFSTSNHPIDRTRCMAAGASDYLVKPPYFSELLALVKNISIRWLQTTP